MNTKTTKQGKNKMETIKGSCLDINTLPKPGDKVWAMTSKIGIGDPREGIVIRDMNIDNKGLSNTYLDIEIEGKNHHLNIMLVYNHLPKMVRIEDDYGEVTIWE